MPTTAIIAIVLTVTLGSLDLLLFGFNLYLSLAYPSDHSTNIVDISLLIRGPGVTAAAAFAGAIILVFARNAGRVLAITVAGSAILTAVVSLPRTALLLMEDLAPAIEVVYLAFDLAAVPVSLTVLALLSSGHVWRWLHRRRRAPMGGSDTPTKRPVGVTIASGLVGIVGLGWLGKTFYTIDTILSIRPASPLRDLVSYFGSVVLLLAALVAMVLAMIGKKAGWTLAVAVSGSTFIYCYRNLVLFITSRINDAMPAPELAGWIHRCGMAVALVVSAAAIIVLATRRQVDWFHSRQCAIVDNRLDGRSRGQSEERDIGIADVASTYG